MDILIPIGLGFGINLVIFIITNYLTKNKIMSLVICLIAFIVVLLSSFIIGSWLGMGIGVISSGMLIYVILVGFIVAISIIKK